MKQGRKGPVTRSLHLPFLKKIFPIMMIYNWYLHDVFCPARDARLAALCDILVSLFASDSFLLFCFRLFASQYLKFF